MTWYAYLACFFSGAFLANFVPHFVKGVCGDRFPTPFSKPPGKGLSSPTVNVIWALANLIIGFLLFRMGNLISGNFIAIVFFIAGIAAMSIPMSVNFQNKQVD